MLTGRYSYDNLKQKKEVNHLMRTLSIFFSCIIILMSLTIFASYLNMKKYYLIEKDGALEIWQGRFAPLSKRLLLNLPGIQPPENAKTVYTMNEVYPLAFQYYISKADTISEVPGVPDFDGIKSYLNKALTFAVNESQRKTVLSRLYGIDIMILLYKADVSVSKGTAKDLSTALSYLQQAESLDLNGHHTDIINQKAEGITSLIEQQQIKDPSH